ncbi:MAG TPA: hypothetical protein VFS43_39815 [Polyangiaceae bacterium]|nr:hypothetical protein [Polyangiaceae bacterium]
MSDRDDAPAPRPAAAKRGAALRPSLVAFFALLALPYALVFPYLGDLNNPNETARLYLTMALVDDASVRVDGPLRRQGWTNDLALVPAPEGAYHACVKGPALSALAAPVYALEGALARLAGRPRPGDAAPPDEQAEWLRLTALTLQFFTVHVPCFAFLLWLERRLRAWSADAVLRLAAVAALGVGTNYLAYSLLFASHAPAAVAAFVALDLPFRAALSKRPRGAPAFAAGLAAGSLPALEYTAAAPALGLALGALAALRGRRERAAFLAGLALPLGLLALYQWRAYGDPLAAGHRLLETEPFRVVSERGFYTLGAPNPRAALALLFDGGFGLFATSPFFALAALAALSPRVLAALRALRPRAPAALRALRPRAPAALRALSPHARGLRPPASRPRARRARALALATAALAFALALVGVSSSAVWRGGWTIGPRYLCAATALLAPLALAGLEAVARRGAGPRAFARALALGLALASFVRGGAVGLFVTTLPEAIERPVAQVLVPFLRLSLVPHHALEPLGVGAAWPFFLAPAGALGALVVAARLVARGRAATSAAALGLAAAAAWPALRLPAGAVDHGPAVRSFFYDLWEPRGRDALARALARAARGPGAWGEVAAAAELAGKPGLAAAAREAAGAGQ